MKRFSEHDLPYLTAELEGIGGIIKRVDQDFLVEELPLYVPSGKGTHVYFGIEKRGMTTHSAVEAVARALDKRPNDIGYAGLKDAHALTRQTLSAEHIDAARAASLKLDNIRILWVSRHTNKLKLGHLRGNRFAVKIRMVHPSLAARASAILDLLARRGVPNYFGPQRFGVRGDNALVAAAVMRNRFDEAISLIVGRPGSTDRRDLADARKLFDAGQYEQAASAWPTSFGSQSRICRAMQKSRGNARAAWNAVNHSLRKLYLSSAQSHLFNMVLARRVQQLDRLRVDDLAWKHVNGACFRVLDEATEQKRCDAFEISPTGPLFGRKMTATQGEPGKLEKSILADSGLDLSHFEFRDKFRLNGARRPLRVPLEDPRVDCSSDRSGSYVELSFVLPAGSYATCVTREVCKAVDSAN